MKYAGLILAGGRGSRFISEDTQPIPKVLRLLLGKPVILWVIDSLKNAGILDNTIVVGYKAEEVISKLGDTYKYVFQIEQKGSGDAVACAKECFTNFDGSLVIMCGDSPLFSSETLKKMMHQHYDEKAFISLASSLLDNPTGYGRIIRDKNENIIGIVEEKCALDEQKAIKEVNGGAYIFDSKWLFSNIHLIKQNEAGEYNLTDMVRIAIEQNKTITSVSCDNIELLGINTQSELEKIENILRSR